MRRLKDLQAMPDEQKYLCTDRSVAERHQLKIPFECGCRLWLGLGIVRIEFYSKNPEYHITKTRFQCQDAADIRTLKPVPNEQWVFDVTPFF